MRDFLSNTEMYALQWQQKQTW